MYLYQHNCDLPNLLIYFEPIVYNLLFIKCHFTALFPLYNVAFLYFVHLNQKMVMLVTPSQNHKILLNLVHVYLYTSRHLKHSIYTDHDTGQHQCILNIICYIEPMLTVPTHLSVSTNIVHTAYYRQLYICLTAVDLSIKKKI